MSNTRNSRLAAAFNANAAEEKAKATLWLNVGYEDEDAEGNKVFISTPFGLPLDTMKERTIPNQEGLYQDICIASNELLAQLIAKAESLNPGEEAEVPLTVRVRRIKEETATKKTCTFKAPVF